MNGARLRSARPEDLPGLLALWPLCFSDEPAFRELFFSMSFRPELTAVAELDGQVAAAAYALPGFSVRIPGQAGIPAAYLYGVGTHPAHRGRGLGEAVSRLAAQLAGTPLCCLLPGEASLRAWYGSRLHAADLSFCAEYVPPETGAAPAAGVLRRIGAEDYQQRREELLGPLPHVRTPVDFLRLADAALSPSGGGLFEWEDGLCAVECTRDSVCAKEFLCRPGVDPLRSAQALRAHFPGRAFSARIPSRADDGGAPFAMAFSLQAPTPTAAGLWWGLALD